MCIQPNLQKKANEKLSISMESTKKFSELGGDQILNELYINPRLYEVEEFLRTEESSPIRISFAGFTPAVRKTIPRTLFRTFLRAEVTPAMACAGVSFQQAQVLYPSLFLYV